MTCPNCGSEKLHARYVTDVYVTGSHGVVDSVVVMDEGIEGPKQAQCEECGEQLSLDNPGVQLLDDASWPAWEFGA